MRYVIKKNHEPENRVAVYLDVQAGSLHENDNQRGLAHFLEHMMFNGSKHFPPGSLVGYFQSLGMSFGGDTNAHTTHNETVYNLILPNGSDKDLDSGFLVMADYAGGALLLDSEIDKERGIILAEKRARDSAQYRAQVASSNFAFRGTRYPERMPIGIEKIIENADRNLLKSYYDAWYRPDNMILVVVGDIDPEHIKELIKKHFGELSSAGPKPSCPEFGTLSLKGTETFYHYESELGTTNVAIQNFWDIQLQNDSLSLEKQELLRMIGKIAFNHRLQRLQEATKLPFVMANYSSGNIVNRIAYDSLAVQVNAEHWQESLISLEHILRQAILYGFDENEIEQAKKEILASLDAAVVTADSQDSRTIARRIINHLNSNRVYQSAAQEKALYGPLTEEVSGAEVNREFSRRWGHTSRLVSVTGDVRLGINGKKDIASIYQQATTAPVAALAGDKAVVFPYLKTSGAVDRSPRITNFQDIDAEQLVFANGLRVNLKKTQFEENKIRVRADFGAGKESAHAPGMVVLAEGVINESGSGRLPQSAIDGIVAGSSMTMSFRAGESSFTWTGTTLNKDFELFSQLLQTRLLDPGIRQNVFTRVKTNLAMMYQKMNQEIEGALPLSIQPFLADYNMHFGLPAWDNIASIDFNAFTHWANSFINPKDLEISVVGDFDRDRVVAVLAKYFTAIELVPPPIPQASAVHFPVGKELALTVDTSIDKSLITIAWPTDDFWDIHRTRRLQLLAGILGDRLRKIIREKLAASYSPSVSSFNSKVYHGYGFIIARILVKSGVEDLILREIFKISESLREDGITGNELERARGPLLTSLKENIRTNQYWLNTVLALSVRFPQQLEWPKTIISDYTSISEADVNQLAEMYLDNEKAAVAKVTVENTLENSTGLAPKY